MGNPPDGQEHPRGHARKKRAARTERRIGTRAAAAVFAVGALVTLVAGVALEQSGEVIAGRAGMSGVVFGATILAACDGVKKPIWVVADGAYAKADFLKPAMALGMTVVSRLRKDAALRTVPGPRPPGRRGRPRPTATGRDRPGQAGRPAARLVLRHVRPVRGDEAVKRYKTFLATWRPAGGAIRVVLVDEPTGWRAYFCTDTSASVADILSAKSNRFLLERSFRLINATPPLIKYYRYSLPYVAIAPAGERLSHGYPNTDITA